MKLSFSAFVLFLLAGQVDADQSHSNLRRLEGGDRDGRDGRDDRDGDGRRDGPSGSRDDPFPLSSSRSIEGNDRKDNLGESETLLSRMADEVSYLDMEGEVMVGGPNPRTVSNLVVAQAEGVSILNARGHSDMLWAWGQFLDHDVDLTEAAAAFGDPNIDIPQDMDDPFVQGGCTSIAFTRSEYVHVGGVGSREQVNLITSFVDASNVYGSDHIRADALRTHSDGLLKTTQNGAMLPFNEKGLDNAGTTDPEFYLAGDIRANEHAVLLSMHTLFVREHNRLADKIKRKYPRASDDDIYQLARKLVGASVQIITYKEFLPALLGPEAPRLRDYSGFKSMVNPSISNEFSTVAYRFGHSLLSATLKMANEHGEIGTKELRDLFFNPGLFENNPLLVDHLLGGVLMQQAQEIDPFIVEDVRSHLFDSPNGEGTCLDLAALNINRARDHGILNYNGVRKAARLSTKSSWDEVTSSPELQSKLAAAYPKGVDQMDAWVGALAENHLPGASVGELLAAVISDQFKRLMDGDRYFFMNDDDLKKPGLDGLWDSRDVSLEKIIRDNTILRNPDTLNGAFFVNNGKP